MNASDKELGGRRMRPPAWTRERYRSYRQWRYTDDNFRKETPEDRIAFLEADREYGQTEGASADLRLRMIEVNRLFRIESKHWRETARDIVTNGSDDQIIQALDHPDHPIDLRYELVLSLALSERVLWHIFTHADRETKILALGLPNVTEAMVKHVLAHSAEDKELCCLGEKILGSGQNTHPSSTFRH